MDHQEAKTRAQRIFGAFDAHNVELLSSQATNDVRLQLGNSPVTTGKADFVAGVTAFLGSVASFNHTILDVMSDGEALAALLEVHYVRLDGAELTLPCCNVFRFRDGLIYDYRSYMDINPVYA